MGRKLSPFEASEFNKGDESLSSGRAPVPSSNNTKLQTQIAEALGSPVSVLGHSEDRHGHTEVAGDRKQAAEIPMNRDCVDLIAAFTCITDPVERQRLLKIVRDAANTDTK